MLRGVVFTGFPWNLMGTVWAFAALPVQARRVIGVHGLSLATLLLAGVPTCCAGMVARVWSGCWWPPGGAAFGLWRWPCPTAAAAGALVLVQGNRRAGGEVAGGQRACRSSGATWG